MRSSRRLGLAKALLCGGDGFSESLSLRSLISLHSEGLLFSSESTPGLDARLILRPQSMFLTGNAAQVPTASTTGLPLPVCFLYPRLLAYPSPRSAMLPTFWCIPVSYTVSSFTEARNLQAKPCPRRLSSVLPALYQRTHTHTPQTCFLSWIRFSVTRIQKGKYNATHLFHKPQDMLCRVPDHTTAIL